MPSKILDLIIRAKDEASKDLAGISSAVTGLNQAMELVTKVAEKMKEAYRFAREGAEIDRLQSKFRNLGRELDLDADFARRLARETGGLVNEFDIVAKSVDALGLRLVDNQADLERLILSGAQLGFDTNELVLALSNQSKKRLDQLGLDLKTFNVNLEAAIQEGMTDQEAFVAAFLDTAENQIVRFGDVGETVLGTYVEFEARLDSIKKAAQKAAAEGLEPFIEDLNTLIETGERLNIVLAITSDQEIPRFIRAFDRGGGAGVVIEGAKVAWESFMDVIVRFPEVVTLLTKGWKEAADFYTGRWVVAVEGLADGLTEAELAALGLKEEIGELSAAELNLAIMEALLAGNFDAVNHLIGIKDMGIEATAAVDGLSAAMDAINGKQSTATLTFLQNILKGGGIPTGPFDFDYSSLSSSSGGGGGNIPGQADPGDANWPEWIAYWNGGSVGPKPKAFQHGGSFTVSGFGGIDSQLVQFRATPGERVTVGGSNEEMIFEIKQVRMGIDRLGRILPITIRDAIERSQ